MEKISDRLRVVLNEMGWKQKDLARITGQTPQVVSNWMNDHIKTLKLEYAAKIAMQSPFNAYWVTSGRGEKYRDTLKRKEPFDIGKHIVLNENVRVQCKVDLVQSDLEGDSLRLVEAKTRKILNLDKCQEVERAVRVMTDGLIPRFRPNQFLLISGKVTPQPGDDCLVTETDGEQHLWQYHYHQQDLVTFGLCNEPDTRPFSMGLEEIKEIEVVTGVASWAFVRS